MTEVKKEAKGQIAILLFAIGLCSALLYRHYTKGDESASSTVEVVFESIVEEGLPIKFYATELKQDLEIGVDGENTYTIENLSNETLYIRPQHSVTPYDAANHFTLTKCFCFNDQALEPKEKKEYAVIYRFDKDLGRDTRKASMRYYVHRIDKSQIRPVRDGFDELTGD